MCVSNEKLKKMQTIHQFTQKPSKISVDFYNDHLYIQKNEKKKQDTLLYMETFQNSHRFCRLNDLSVLLIILMLILKMHFIANLH